jgi:plastocyanin
MSGILQPGRLARRVVLRRAVGAGVGAAIAAVGMRVSLADDGTKVTIGNFAFVPTTLRVQAGTRVTWVNQGDFPHSIVCPPLSVHSHPTDTDESFSYTFVKPGVYNYLCGLHPFMHG